DLVTGVQTCALPISARPCARAVLGHVAVAGRGTAGGAGRLEAVGRAVGPRARAVLDHVAVTGRGTTGRAGRLEAIRRAARSRPRSEERRVGKECRDE